MDPVKKEAGNLDPITVNSTVGADGVLRVTVPIGASDANREVRVTIEPASPAARMTQDEWRQFVLSTAGSVTDPTFVRHPQGEFERREELP
jgi:hypothetical protein